MTTKEIKEIFDRKASEAESEAKKWADKIEKAQARSDSECVAAWYAGYERACRDAILLIENREEA